jgi:hypothetical protein
LKLDGVLLETQIAVRRQENIEFLMGQREQSLPLLMPARPIF